MIWRSPRLTIASRNRSSARELLRVSEEIQQALHENKPVVALESTIYTHGFPYPDSLSLASRLESLVRLNGGVPATIAILDGVPRVGLDASDLSQLLTPSPSRNSTLKISRRDLAFATSLRSANGKPFSGGTTVSGTMVLAHLAGIRIFATGGLGGVHRGAESTFDISADLTELGRTPVAVISSGCKSFLDIPKTLEVLETQGVAVATFADGRSTVNGVDFPAFYTRESGVRSPIVLADERDAARVIVASGKLGLQSGLLFANPIPEPHSIPLAHMETAIAQALSEASKAGAIGAASTPFILDKIKELTGSKSVEANRALVEANVIRGTKVAVSLRELEIDKGLLKEKTPNDTVVGPAASAYTSEGIPASLSARGLPPSSTSNNSESSGQAYSSMHATTISSQAHVFVAGSLALDLSCDYLMPRNLPPQVSNIDLTQSNADHVPRSQTSNPAQISQSLGGVGHNVARAAHLMGASVELCSAVGDDLAGKAAIEGLERIGMSSTGIQVLSNDFTARTAQYVAINDGKKDLVLAMADMSILTHDKVAEILKRTWIPRLRESTQVTHLVLDANWSQECLAGWLNAAGDINSAATNMTNQNNGTGNGGDLHITYEPVSVVKATSIFRLSSAKATANKFPRQHNLGTYPTPSIHLAVPNTLELHSMHTAASTNGFFERDDWWAVVNAFGIPSSGARDKLTAATSAALVDVGVPQMALRLLPFLPSIAVKLGRDGVLLAQILGRDDERLRSGEYAPFILSRCAESEEVHNTRSVGGIYMRLFPTPETVDDEDVVSVNGVGDTFAGVVVAGLAKAVAANREKSIGLGESKARNVYPEHLIDVAQRAAALTLQSKEAVHPDIGALREDGA